MKKFKTLFLSLIVISSLFLTGCGKDWIIVNNTLYESYGIFNQAKKSDCVKYEVEPWGVAWSIILFETIVVPVYVIGWDLHEPLGVIKDCKDSTNELITE